MDRRLIMNLYMPEKEIVRVMQEYSEESYIERGVRHGCCLGLSPLLIILYTEAMLKETMEVVEDGINVGGKLVNVVRFSDRQGTLLGAEDGLQKIKNKLNAIAEKFGMKINIKKIEVTRVLIFK